MRPQRFTDYFTVHAARHATHAPNSQRAPIWTPYETRRMFQVKGKAPLSSALSKRTGGLLKITYSLHREGGEVTELRAVSVLWRRLSVHNCREVLARLELVTLF